MKRTVLLFILSLIILSCAGLAQSNEEEGDSEFEEAHEEQAEKRLDTPGDFANAYSEIEKSYNAMVEEYKQGRKSDSELNEMAKKTSRLLLRAKNLLTDFKAKQLQLDNRDDVLNPIIDFAMINKLVSDLEQLQSQLPRISSERAINTTVMVDTTAVAIDSTIVNK
ncbi:hypothetical protein [Emticicia fontis]